LETRRGSKPVVKAHIELVELLIANNEAALAPPKDAQPPPQMVTVSENDARNLLVQSLKPVYPPIAKAAMVSGPVVLQVNIGTDGHFIAARVLSGPPMLQQAAVEAVKKCSFKPMVQNGEAVQMTTTITIPFKLP
jgi:protein TonB